MSRILVIAEAGVNHNGDELLAKELIDIAESSGADYVKFQMFEAEKLVTTNAKKAEYQIKNDSSDSNESQFEMLKKLELDRDSFMRLSEYCKRKKVSFLSTAFDVDSADFLVNNLKQNILKIPSGELTNAPFLLDHTQFNKNIILSTGMASIKEIKQALGVIAFGYLSNGKKDPSISSFQVAFSSTEGQKILKDKVTLLHCTTEYPTPFEEANLKCIQTLKTQFGLKTGFSDHTAGISASIASVAFGASIIEKHFTIDKNLDGPDHKASLDPGELSIMIKEIRNVEIAIGDGIKKPTKSELKNMIPARQSIVALKKIKSGSIYTTDNIGTRRPGSGITPLHYWEVLGKKAHKDFEEFDEISLL